MREAERTDYEWVFRSCYASVLRTTTVILHDRGRAEEVTQDAFLRLYERWRSAQDVEHPGAWVRKVAVRGAIRSARRNGLKSTSMAGHEESAWDQLPDVDLARAVASLPAQQRAAVALFYLDDLSVEEVARHLGVSPSTVKQHLFRARTRLAALLSEPAEVTSDVDR